MMGHLFKFVVDQMSDLDDTEVLDERVWYVVGQDIEDAIGLWRRMEGANLIPIPKEIIYLGECLMTEKA